MTRVRILGREGIFYAVAFRKKKVLIIANGGFEIVQKRHVKRVKEL